MSIEKKIVIVGGGTAGWMAALLFAKQWKHKGFTVVLVESADIPTIGVGEGSTPYIRHFFSKLNIAESEWMPRCSATFKNGISFDNWTNKPAYKQYFHPFPSGFDQQHFDIFKQHVHWRRNGANIQVHPNDYFLTASLADHARSPIASVSSIDNAGHAYHFDAGLLAKFLCEKAIPLGVQHIKANVENVEVHPNGDIAAVNTHLGQHIEGDLFIDCSGFKQILIHKVLQVPFVSFRDNLLNDSAIAIASKAEKTPKLQTLSQAMDFGWRWKIPLTTRTGNGYVYSSQFVSSNKAEEELRRKLGALESDAEARHIRMKVGRSARHWERNCVAIGLSGGFIEPLEATGLQIIQVSIEQFISHWEKGEFGTQYQTAYNDGVNAVFEHIRDYIVLHYLANSRTNSTYWQSCRGDISISDSLSEVLRVWSTGGDLDAELKRQKIDQYYPSLSWYVLLTGMGILPESAYTDPKLLSSFANSLNSVKSRVEEYSHHFLPCI